MHRYLVLSIIVLATLPELAKADELLTMHNELQAKQVCAGDGVVWMDLTSGRYVYQGSKYYGKGKNAAYVCEVQAIKAGGHPVLNTK